MVQCFQRTEFVSEPNGHHYFTFSGLLDCKLDCRFITKSRNRL